MRQSYLINRINGHFFHFTLFLFLTKILRGKKSPDPLIYSEHDGNHWSEMLILFVPYETVWPPVNSQYIFFIFCLIWISSICSILVLYYILNYLVTHMNYLPMDLILIERTP